MLKRNNLLKEFLELPIAIYYLLFKSSLSLILIGLLIFSILIFGYIALTG